MLNHRIVSVEMTRRASGHENVTAVHVRDAEEDNAARWTLAAVLKAMNRAERFYTQSPNGRQARVQRYSCPSCKSDHIRTHISDTAIGDMRLLVAR
jgi:hypothetical protein